MDNEQAAEIVRQLADGLDPSTGEPFEPGSPYEQPRVVRALYVARRALEAAPAPKAPARRPENAGIPWSAAEDARLVAEHAGGAEVRDLADAHGRSVQAIRARLVKLGRLPPSATRFAVKPS